MTAPRKKTIRFEARLNYKDQAIAFTRDEAPGAIPNRSLVVKCNTEPGDGHLDGAPAHVLGSIGPHDGTYGYFVEWLDKPNVPVFITGTRIRTL